MNFSNTVPGFRKHGISSDNLTRSNTKNIIRKSDNEGIRIPEIQLLNRFYGLIPKSFLSTHQIEPTAPPLKPKLSIRPQTASQSKVPKTPKPKTIRRSLSVEESKPDTNYPLVARRISLTRSPLKVPALAHAPQSENIDPILHPLPTKPTQRVIKIDLTKLKWDEISVADDIESLQVPKPRNVPEKHKCENMLEIPHLAEHWTVGKTTAERKAKLGKTFSIHPSFAQGSHDFEDEDGPDPECLSYGSSMIKTGRRQLHVENPSEDVETMVSSSRGGQRSQNMEKAQDIAQALKATATLASVSRATTPPVMASLSVALSSPPSQKNVAMETKTKASTLSQPQPNSTATEKRVAFSEKKWTSLPAKLPENKTRLKKPIQFKLPCKLSPARKSPIKRPPTCVTTKCNSKTRTEINDRPKTAPIPSTSHKPKNRRGPLKATEQFRIPAQQRKTVGFQVKPRDTPNPEESSEVPDCSEPPLELPTLGNCYRMAGRGFSFDESTLLNHSTAIPDGIGEGEAYLQSCKRREECVRIFEKMKQNGCAVRLDTIFRGLLTPSDYRTFMAADTKTAKPVETFGEEANNGDEKARNSEV